MASINVSATTSGVAGPQISAEHLGANFLFNRVSFDEGVGAGGFDETAASLGITHVRYPGGTITERYFDPANPDNAFQVTDLLTGTPVSNANRRDLTPLSEFLAEAAEMGWRVTVVVPTARYLDFIGTAAGRAAVADEIAGFVQGALSGPNGATIEGFEIGNEWYGVDLTASQYGAIANVIAPAVAQGIADVRGGGDPFVALQLGQQAARTTQTTEILAQMSSSAVGAIDTVVLHNYRPKPWDEANITAGKFNHVAVAEAAAGRDLDVLISEWNVGNASDADGLLQAAGILEMFDQMLHLGMDRAHIWPVLENNTTRLAGNVTVEDEAAPLMIGGEIYRQMVQSLPGTQSLQSTTRLDVDANGSVDFLLHAFGGAEPGAVVFLSSLRGTTQNVSLDLSAMTAHLTGTSHLWMTRLGVGEGVDPTSHTALPDVSAIAMPSFGPAGAGTLLALTLDPFEVLRLEFAGPAIAPMVVVDTSEIENLRLTEAAEVFVMGRDGVRDLLRDFDLALDRLDVSALGIADMSGFSITTVLKKDGTPNWLQLSEPSGAAELALRFSDGISLDPARLGAQHFIFAAQQGPAAVGQLRPDTGDFDSLFAEDVTETFRLSNDGIRDLIRGFDVTRDIMDVSAWGAETLDDLDLSVQVRRDGTPNWLNVVDPEGQAEVALRFAPGQALADGALTADNFLFATPGTPGPAAIRQVDEVGFTDFRGVTGAEVYAMLDDGDPDLIRAFERGIDRIDISDWGLSGFGDLTLTNQLRRDGSVNWVQVIDGQGEIELKLRLAGEQTDSGTLTASDFIF